MPGSAVPGGLPSPDAPDPPSDHGTEGLHGPLSHMEGTPGGKGTVTTPVWVLGQAGAHVPMCEQNEGLGRGGGALRWQRGWGRADDTHPEGPFPWNDPRRCFQSHLGFPESLLLPLQRSDPCTRPPGIFTEEGGQAEDSVSHSQKLRADGLGPLPSTPSAKSKTPQLCGSWEPPPRGGAGRDRSQVPSPTPTQVRRRDPG